MQQLIGLQRVLALQPVLIEGFKDGVELGKSDRQAAVDLLHLLDQGFIYPTTRLALRLTSATQAP